MAETKFLVRKAAVLGAGVMGAQIAAHLIDARVPTLLFDLPAKEADKSGIVETAIAGLKKLQPSPLAGRDTAALLQAANYDEHLPLLAECDLVIEAIAERMDWKTDLYRKVAPHLAPHAIFASNTSGLSINRLAEALPPELRPRFCGVHFFNPPRYMHLVGDHSLPRVAAGRARWAGALPRHHARQGRGPRQGHAELRRQPHRGVLDVGDRGQRRKIRHPLRCRR